MRSPLSVAIDDGSGFRLVTSRVRGLSFSKTAPGGNRQASCELVAPRSMFPNLGPADQLKVMDPATARIVWDGFTDNPGEQSGRDGQGFNLSAQGGMILAADRAERYVYRDTQLDSWEANVDNGGTGDATAEIGTFPEDAGTRAGKPALFMQFPRGMVTPSGAAHASFSYRQLLGSSQSLGAIRFFEDGGSPDTDYNTQAYHLAGAGFAYYQDTLGAAGFSHAYTAAANLPDNWFGFMFYSASNVTVPNDNKWWAVGEIAVLGQPLDRYGNWYGNPRNTYVLASEVAEDLLGRVLKGCDPGSAVIEASTFPIDSLTFLDPATAANVFDALVKFEPDFDWGIGSMRGNGLRSFWWRKWPTQPRYILGDGIDIDLPGTEDTLCNRVAVDWEDIKGVKQVTVVGAYVPELGNKNPVLSTGKVDPTFVGRIKDADRVTLEAGKASLANAQRIGEQVLASKNRVQVAGTAVVDRPIMDLATGTRVMPWNLEPGCVVRMQSKGVDVRCTETTYTDNDGAASLTLGTPVPSVEDLIAGLGRR